MSGTVTKGPRLESLLARLLRCGTWLASVVTGLGMAMSLAPEATAAPWLSGLSAAAVVAAGIALFIAMPVLRVLLMLAVFIRERDYRLAAVTALVLMTIVAGFAIGVCGSNLQALAH
jgi:hypothetical protein